MIEYIHIIITKPSDLDKIKAHYFYHHIKDIPCENIIEFSVIKKDENTSTIGYKTTNTIISEINVIFKDGKKTMKTTKTVQNRTITTKIPKVVNERKKWRKFGAAAISNHGVTIIGKNTTISPVDLKKKSIPVKNQLTNEDKLLLIRNPNMKFSERKKLKLYTKKNTKDIKTSNKYIPPNKRRNPNNPQRKKYTVFVSGFREYFTRNDLMNMIPRNIKFTKVSLPIANNKCRGFGFIDVNTKKDMDNIIQFFDGKRLDNMIIHANKKK